MFDDNNAEAYTKALYGENAVHCALNFIVQDMGKDEKGEDCYAIIAETKDPRFKKLLRNSKTSHQLILGDAVIRPHVVAESDHLRGVGIGGIMRSGWDMSEWVEKGKLLFKL